jgi:hypothetical protein
MLLPNKLKTNENSFVRSLGVFVYVEEAFCSNQHISYIDSVRPAHLSYRHYYKHQA